MSSIVRECRRVGAVILIAAISIAISLLAQDKEELVRKSLPLLSDKIRSLDQNIYPAFIKYADGVLRPDWIKSDDGLSLLFKERESLLDMINRSEPLSNFLSGETERYVRDKSGDLEAYDSEFELIGIRMIFAEGMFAGLAEGPVLKELVSRVASEPYRLYIRLVETYAGSYGSEYTYMDLGPEMEAVELAEELITRYPDSKYIDSTMQILGKALFPLTDWHVMLPSDPTVAEKPDYNPLCIVGELHTSVFRSWTDIGQPTKFLEAYPMSRFHDVVAKIVKEPSEILDGKSVYAVIVDEFNDEQSARKAILNFLLKGIDIPHLITLSETSYVVAYRFFDDREKAEKALERIKNIKPNAMIRELLPHDY
jgi:hypothetical protein